MTEVTGDHPFPVGLSHLRQLANGTYRDQEGEMCNYGCVRGAAETNEAQRVALVPENGFAFEPWNTPVPYKRNHF